MATKVKVTYLDGRSVESAVTPRAQIETERHIGGSWQELSILASYYLAWVALNKAGKESRDFETWLDQIADVEEVEAEPAQPAESADTSSEMGR